jgi:hypothetical protein
MGLDMWLPSIFDFNDEEQVKHALEPVINSAERAVSAGVNINPMVYMERMFDAYRATGGYYRARECLIFRPERNKKTRISCLF